ncbi:MAG TPA: lactonase family protein [Steroidobacteraceae bacterium]|nr:lactonase family protein [Steroidobacteraceae bacterium]
MTRSRLALTLLLTTFTTFTMAKNSLLYIATQDPAKMGITVAEFDSATGKLSAPTFIQETRDPAHFTVTRDGGHLYMCNTGTPGGLSAFAIKDRKTGALQFLNYEEAQGRGPSYVSVDKTGKVVLDANYGGGYIEAFTLAKDGSLGERTAMIQHTGSSVHPQRQNKPYAHWIHTDPTNKFALVADLGTDQIVVYALDAKTGKLTPNNPAAVHTPPGTGPRHLAFHPNGKWVYSIAELANEVMAFNWDSGKGTLTLFQEAKTLDPSFTGTSTAAEIAVHSNGKFLYASNRGEDTLVVYSIDPKTGELTLKQRVSSRGKVPRYFTFDATNKWLIVGNQESASIAVFSVDAASGELAPVGDLVSLNKPMGIVFVP